MQGLAFSGRRTCISYNSGKRSAGGGGGVMRADAAVEVGAVLLRFAVSGPSLFCTYRQGWVDFFGVFMMLHENACY